MRDYLLVVWYTMCWWTVIVLSGFLAFQFIKEFIKVIRGKV